MKNQRLTFTWTNEQIAEMVWRARDAGCTGDTDRELIYQYFCQREEFQPVKHGGRREEAIAATVAYQRKKKRAKKKPGQ